MNAPINTMKEVGSLDVLEVGRTAETESDGMYVVLRHGG